MTRASPSGSSGFLGVSAKSFPMVSPVARRVFVVGDGVVWPPFEGVTAQRTTLVNVSRAPKIQDEVVRSVCSRTAPTKADSIVLAKEVGNQLGGLVAGGGDHCVRFGSCQDPDDC